LLFGKDQEKLLGKDQEKGNAAHPETRADGICMPISSQLQPEVEPQPSQT
jgi:hypothetical protein